MKRAALVAFALLIAGVVSAHTVDPSEVVAYFNSPQTREAYGVTRAAQIKNRPDLLVIEVGAKWFGLAPQRRQELAIEWRDLWRHSVKTGRVSIVDSESRPVVHYLPEGGATVVDEASR